MLGPLEVDEGRISLAPRDQVVLEALAACPGEVVRAEALAQALWGERLPPSWPKVVQGCVSRLRKALGAAAIVTTGAGYRLALHRDDVDHVCFEDLLLRAGDFLAAGEPERARYASSQALRLWRGEPLGRLSEWESGRIEAERLAERHLDAEDLYAEAAVRAGRHGDVLGELHRMVAQAPTRERRWGLLALAQYQAGRQAEALGTLQRARATLVNDFGLDPGPRLAELAESILRQDPTLVAETAPAPEGAVCPYLGLVAYDVSDAPAYFGREADVAACLARLDQAGVLAVVGPSGCGKSSLVRAGVAATLVRDGHHVQVVTPGAHPEDMLAQAPTETGTVLVVDQCEEALALAESSPERKAFFDSLVDFAAHGPLVVSLRADRLGELAAHPAFAHLTENGLYLLGAMSPAQLRQAIEGPAAQAGLRLEPGLVDLLVREAEGSPASLPLLSHVLRQTWRHREGAALTVNGYTATGGVREAVAQSAEGVYRELTPTQQLMLRDLMLRLVSSDDTGEPVRTRVPRRTVASDEEHEAVIERLVSARLLSTDGDTLEIAHESLATAWPRLRSWLDDDVDGLRIMRHLAIAADSWDELGQPDSELYRGTRQARAVEWRDRAHPSLSSTEKAFLDASTDLAAKEEQATQAQVRRERRLNRRLRLGLACVAVLLTVAVVAASLAVTSADLADQQTAAAEKQSLAADARRLGAEALRSSESDRSLLLAAAGASLDNSIDTRTNLLATLDRTPALAGSARSAGRIFHLAVNSATNQVAVMAADGIGLDLYDGATLHRQALPEGLIGGTVVARPDGDGYAVSISGDLVEQGQAPPILLLDRTGARSRVQLGGIPPRYHVLDMGFPRRWYLAYSPNSRWFTATLIHLQDEHPPHTFVWDVNFPQRPAAILSLGPQGSAPTISPDGRTLYSATFDERLPPRGGSLLVTDVPSSKVRRTLTADELGVIGLDDVLAQSPDGRTLAVGAGVEVVLVDTETLRAREHLSGQGLTQAVAFSPDGSHLAASGERLMVWDLSGDEPVEVLSNDVEADDPAFSGDGKTLYTETSAGLIQAWDVIGDRRFLPARLGQPLDWPDVGVRLSPDRSKIGYVANGPKFRVRDMTTGRLGPEIAPAMAQGSTIDIAWHPDSTTLNMTSGDPWVRTWDSRTGRQIAKRRLAPPPSTEGAAIAFFSVDGQYLLVGTTQGRIHILDARTLTPTRAPIQVYNKASGEPDTRDVENFAPSADLHTAYLSDAIVDYVSGIVRPFPDLAFPVVDLKPSPDGKRLLVDTGPTGVGLLDATTMEWIARPSAAQAGLMGYDVAWSDDGSLVASANEGRLSFWNGRSGARLGSATVKWEGDPSFSKDGKQLLFARTDGSVLTWNLDPDSWIRAACRLAGRPLTEQEWHNYLPNRPFQAICASNP